MNSRRIALILALVALVGVAAWLAVRPAPRSEGNLTGAQIGGAFSLVDQDGRRVTDADFRGKYRLMYFGYTYCPDICPVDVQEMAAGLKAFAAAQPRRAAEVAAIFVTVDPSRDTPAVLRTFVRAFDDRLIGLTGTAAEIDAAKRTFRIYGNRAGPEGSTDYLVDHSALTYLFGPDGKPIAFVAHDGGPEAIERMLDDHVA